MYYCVILLPYLDNVIGKFTKTVLYESRRFFEIKLGSK